MLEAKIIVIIVKSGKDRIGRLTTFSRHFLAHLMHPGQLTPILGSLELSRQAHLKTEINKVR